MHDIAIDATFTLPALVALILIVVGLALRNAFKGPKRERNTISGSLYQVAAPAASGAPEQFFIALHGLLRPAWRRKDEGQPWISLELSGAGGQASFYIWIPEGQRPFIEDLLRAAYPGVELRPVEDDPFAQPPEGAERFASVGLLKSKYLPIRTKTDGDALASLLSTLGRPQDSEGIRVSLLVRPKANGWQVAARSYARRLRSGRSNFFAEAFLPKPKERPLASSHNVELAKAIEEKAQALGFDCVMRVWTRAKTDSGAGEFLRAVGAALRIYDGPNSFTFKPVWRPKTFLQNLRERRFAHSGRFILNTAELVALWHLPEEPPHHVEAVRSPKLPPPPETPQAGRVIGLANYPGRERPVALSGDDSRRHLHVLGPTGYGQDDLALEPCPPRHRGGSRRRGHRPEGRSRRRSAGEDASPPPP